MDRTISTDDDFATSIPYSTVAGDFPPLPEFVPFLLLDLDSDSNSDSNSESDSDSNSEP
jgi:hypothetical protein